MLKSLKNNKQGLILVVVLMIVIVMTTLTISIISLNISQVNVAEKEIKRIQTQPVARGMLDMMFSIQQSNLILGSPSDTEFLGNTEYHRTVDMRILTGDPLINGVMNSTIIIR